MEANVAAEVYSKKGEVIKKFSPPDKLPTTKKEEKELFDYYKDKVKLDKEIDINEVNKLVCHSFDNPTKTIIFKRDKSEWKKEIKDN
jgi:hypothetical protein